MLRTLSVERNAGIGMRLQALGRSVLRPAALGALMFLAMRAELLLRASPLAVALMAAALAAGESAGALVAGCLVGMLRLPLTQIPLLPALSCAGVLAVELSLELLPAARRWQPDSRAALTAGLAALLPPMIAGGGEAIPSLQALACAALAAVSAPFLRSALLLRPGRTRFMLQEKLGVALIILASLAGLYALLPALAEAMATLIVLLLPSLGAASGVLTGIALAAGGAGPLKLASLALCAFAAGVNLCETRWQRALALSAAVGVARLAMGPDALGPQWAIAAAAVSLLLPEHFTERSSALIEPRPGIPLDPDRLAREVTAETGRRMRSLGDAFAEMAEGCAAPTEVPDEQELICEMRGRLCTGCVSYEECWAGMDNRAVHLLCELIGEALNRVDAPPGMRVLFSDGEIPPHLLRCCRRGKLIPDRLGLLLRDFAERRRSEIKRCATGQLMSVQFMQAREILYDLAERSGVPVHFQGAQLEQLRAALEAEGLGDCAVFAGGIDADELTLSRDGAGWTREEVRRAGAALGHTLDGRFAPELRGGTLRFVRRARYFADTGASCQSGVAGQVCGDSHLVRMLGTSKLILMLSDGMGSGEAAAAESRQTLQLLWRFLEAGISRDLALETVNQQMLMRTGEDIFATLDLCVIDLNTGVAEFTKLAACRTLILRDGELLPVEGGQLPLGILERVQPTVRRMRLRAGDTLVMGSDGVMETGEALMIERAVRNRPGCPPEQLAEQLVREAGLRRGEDRRDDLTCICARILDVRGMRRTAG